MYNQVTIIGKLGKSPNKFTLANGSLGAFLSIATSDSNKETQWHSVVVYDKLAEQCIKYLYTGRLVHVVGSIIYRPKEKDGVKFMEALIKGREVNFLDQPSKRQEDTNINVTTATTELKPLPSLLTELGGEKNIIKFDPSLPLNTSAMFGFKDTYIEHAVERDLKYNND